MAYEKDKDYQALIDQAVKQGDYQSAAKYEQARNEKIADLDKTGANTYGATTTNRFSGWLDKTDYGNIGKQQMALGASAEDVLDTYNKRYDKASGTEGMEQYENDEIQQEMWDYIMANTGKPSFNFDTGSRPSYTSDYSARIDAMLDEILNREDFSYDVNADPLAQQYQAMYEREGNRAMNDTLAEAAAGAGGMNSYAITAAQQANDYYAAKMGDKVPELYQLAYEMYLQDKRSDVEDLGLLQQMDDTQYSRYRDTMADWQNDRDFAYGKYRDDMGDFQWKQEFGYAQDRDDIADSRYDKEWEYGVSRDEVEDSRYESETAYNRVMDMLAAGIMPSGEQLSAAGVSSAEATAYIAANQKKTSSGSSGGGKTGSNTGGGGGTDWSGADAWFDTYGEDAMEDYIGQHYKALGFSNKSQALSAWKNHRLELGNDVGIVHPETIDGKPLDEYSDAAGNYESIASMCETIYSTQGKEAVLEMLEEAYSTGALNTSDYRRLYNMYRGMASTSGSAGIVGGGGGGSYSF